MPLGFLKSAREPKRPAPDEQNPVAAQRPDRAIVLGEVEELGIGMFWATDAEGHLSFLSQRALVDLGTDSETMIGKPLTQLFHDVDDEDGGPSQRSLAFKLKARSKLDEQIVAVPNGRGATRWWRLNGRPLTDAAGTFKGYRGSAVDISAQYAYETQVARQSQVDELTGLTNRRKLNERLTATLAAFRASQRSCALMMLDLDRFKQVNDTMGHPAGDELLKQVAQRLSSIVKDYGEVGRLGGDEFQVLLPDMDDRGTLGELANRIVQSISQPYQINGRRAIIGTSIGIAIAPYDGVDTDELTRAADMALYSAKETRGGTFCFFTSELRDAASKTAMLGERLRDAVDRGELKLAYQPLVDPLTNEVKCFEALLRWHDEDEGDISPAQFIPVAENDDLIIRIGEMALKQACMDALSWPDTIRVAVNVSAKQFIRPGYRKAVAAALQASGLPPGRLELEITESVFVGDLETVDAIFRDLKKLGVRLSLDDFGTGYSSLGYLKHGHFNKIKIDQSFVRGCTENGDTNPAIITAIVALAKALGMETVAEGVEAMDELELVKARGADLVQGYIFSRPITQDQVLAQFAEGSNMFRPSGPPRHRAERITIFRKVGLIHEDHYYDVILRNLSKTGARITGLAGVPVGTDVVLDLGHGQLVVSKVVNATENSQGLKFETSMISDGSGGFMTRHRISPYSLAEAGIPLAALGAGAFPLAKWREANKTVPKFVQLELSAPGA
ncbi:diguanylate cyclase (GGDEF)-like protein/PAS domain S-box-containing protein [Erythromicrobium ramosum]|uniref:Diguanylate cyclase (GGDEF)-like protein/PAS domain S-box-containing protein n=1 Tax=Erythrobacter ramosus TaxID=35811 RepID=A0A6I4UQ09_9SPHN|nr:EAL domain-containing protein [Erythrobacter ramosus]MBB3776857.1 diguanylate cyclase (GGDEF)-like protein/PAS domain S-box-containing protein [Erythrobacter ramosus]MXP39709.1 EAL domain-containing protein [Erythrobacter ramosus]